MSGFEVLAAEGPLARLVKRDGTLDGSVPLRVAQACVPLLEGNAVGHQIVFDRRLVVRAALGRKGLVDSPELKDVDRMHRTAVPILVSQGILRRGGAWATQLEKKWWWVERGVLRIWTGLLVRPRRGTWLRVSGAGSRAILGLDVRASYVGDDTDFVPFVVDFEAVEDGMRLEGEVANVVAIVPGARAKTCTMHEMPEVARAHAAFYDAKYFATKKGEVTKKYRKLIAGRDADGEAADVRVVHVAGPPAEVVRIDRVLAAGATAPVAAEAALDVVRFRNAVGFSAHYDGNTLAIEPDRDALAAGGRAVEAALGADFVAKNKGSVLYLTKYFTPHPHGEPHFFVKPWSFVMTAPGWSCLLDGHRGEGFDVMRGVVWTDRFHATPAVFQLRPGQRVKVAAGAPLLDVIPLSRAVAAESFTQEEVR